LVRRHLTSSQKAVIALDLLPLLEKEARERQTLAQKCAKVSPNGKGKASQIAARLTKTNGTYVELVKAVSKAAPELIEKIRNGNLSVPDAKRLSEIPKQKRKELLRQANGQSHNGEIFQHWKSFGTPKAPKPVHRTANERKSRIEAATLIHGDCRRELKKIASHSIDCIITDPPYPEVRPRGKSYPRISETDWHSLMRDVVTECRRILKPKGSAVFVLQPNAAEMGKMRLWPWRFVLWAGESWNLVEDAYWWNPTAIPTRGAKREFGLLRPSLKWLVWLGPPDCFRNQNNVLWATSDALAAKRREAAARIVSASGTSCRNSTITKSADERGGTTPFNLIPLSASGQPAGTEDHPAATPYDLAAWWCRYLLPSGGVLLDPFAGSGTMLLAGLDHGASRVIGIEREKRYLQIAKRRITNG
jgi:site-specific DNA-methyltransferase (adenine-specific)/site-specific DNA-methyltransferase (cytosine-N4-specific)